MGSNDWRPLTRSDLRTFDDTATNAVLFAMDRGAVGRISSNGHVLLRAPNGETMSVSRNTNKSKQVLELNIRRIFGDLPTRREQETDGANALQLAPAPKVDLAEEPTLECRAKNCDATFVTEGARYAHEHKEHHCCDAPGCSFVSTAVIAKTTHYKAAHLGIKPKGRPPRSKKVVEIGQAVVPPVKPARAAREEQHESTPPTAGEGSTRRTVVEAIQALIDQECKDRDERIAALEAENAELQARLQLVKEVMEA